MKAMIMAGGKGTRIASITNDEIPKPMLKVGGKPILEHQVECLKRNGIVDIVIGIGHLGSVISDYFSDGSKWGVNITYIVESEEEPLGTAGSLYYLKGKVDDDFIVVFGDVYFNVDLLRMMDFHKKHSATITLLTHPNSHPFDSDLLIVDDKNRVMGFDSKENDRSGHDYNNIVNSGIYVLSPKVLDIITEPVKSGIEKDVISRFIDSGKVYSYHSTEYVKDMGTPERYRSVNNDYENGIPEAKNLENKQKCIFLDRDGTINEYRGIINNKDDLVLMDGVAEAIRRINESEYLCIVITNQPVVARGECTIDELDEIHKHLATLLGREGAYIDELYYCPHHPDSGYKGEIKELKVVCDCRKPKIGLVEKAENDYNIDLKKSMMIGDSSLDIKMAENAGMKGILLKTGVAGLDGKFEINPDMIEKDLLSAVEKILNSEKKHE